MSRHKLLLLETYTKHATTILFISGFFVDMILLPDISDKLTQYIGLFYLCGIGSLIFFREWVIARNTASSSEQRFYSVITFLIAYLSGSALSFVFVYAIRGSVLSVAWPLLVFLFLCILANEIISSHRYRFSLDIGVFLVAVLFYLVFMVPIVIRSQSDFVFSVSLVLSAVCGLVYVYFLQFVSEVSESETPRGYALAIGIPMFVGMLYILNVLPAVPLSLGTSGVYHSITRYDDGSYLATEEIDANKFSYIKTPVYHMTAADDGVYVYASIKAPAQVTAPISHVWEHYNNLTRRWEVSTIVPYTVEGGRNSGYRAYSFKHNVEEGLWRVTVRLGSNRIVGVVQFKIVKTADILELKKVIF